MIKFKFFPKNFLFITLLVSSAVLISNLILSLLLPKIYVANKERDLFYLSQALCKEVDLMHDKEEIVKYIEKYSQDYNLDIFLSLDTELYEFHYFRSLGGKYHEEQILSTSESESKGKSHSSRKVEDSEDLNWSKDFHDEKMLVLVSNDFETASGINGNIQIKVDLDFANEVGEFVFILFPYTIGISLIISLAAFYFYTNSVMKPIKHICQRTKQMKDLNPDAYCQIDRNDEIGELAANINSLYDNLWSTIQSLEKEIKHVSEVERIKVDFLRCASHELKTPLTSINIILENMILNVGRYRDRDVYLIKCKEMVEQLSKMVQEILDTSNLHMWSCEESKVIDIKELILDVLEPYHLLAKSKGLDMKVSLPYPLVTKVNPKLLTKAISNIISNSIHYTESGKEIRIFFEGSSLIIENDCQPIEESDLAQIFDAFYRPGFSRNRNKGGNGLGLYIVSQIFKITELSFSFKEFETGMRFKIDFELAKRSEK